MLCACGARTGLGVGASGGTAAVKPATVVAGPYTVCAIREQRLYCWGNNRIASLGDGSTVSKAMPQPVALSGKVKWAHVGLSYTCALLEGGSASCWGTLNRDNGTSVTQLKPEVVSGTAAATYLSSGTSQFACIREESGAVRCWGEAAGYFGLLGANPEISLEAREVPGAFDSLQISGGDTFVCAVGAEGQVSCAGSNGWGQLGDGTLKNHVSYANVVGLPVPATQVGAAGNGNACALAGDRVLCWGSNRFGQLGDGTTGDRSLPVEVKGLEAVSAIAVGRKHVCVLNQSGTVDCWGSNVRGALGDGTRISRTTPTRVQGLSFATEVAVGDDYTCANTADGIYCWGDNDFGEMGDGTFGGERLLPVKVELP